MPRWCPQSYDSLSQMEVVPCDGAACGNWLAATARCTVETGAEDLSASPAWPRCPIANECQHGVQAARDGDGACSVRKAGAVCASALSTTMPAEEARDHPLAYDAEFDFSEDPPMPTRRVFPITPV